MKYGRFKISVSGLAVMFLASWAFGSAARADQESGTVKGEVLINAAPAAGAVVYLQPQGSRPSEPPPREVTIIQEQLRFKPSFSVVPAGTTVRFENHDDEIHNIFSKSGANRFDTGAHLPGTVKKVTLKEPGAVPLRCRTHQNMRGLIFVSPSPYYSVTDDRGQFEIRNIPSGSYRIEAWHPRLTAEESAPILGYLYQHQIRPEFTCRFRWRPGSLAFWDNRCAQHNAINDYQGHRRLLHRITLAGDKPS